MAEQWRVTIEDSSDLGFALECLTAWAVDLDEFKTWIYRAVVDLDEIHDHLLRLGDATNRFEPSLKWKELISFYPGGDLTARDSRAIDGIAYARNPDHESDATTRGTTLKALEASPHIIERFKFFFPDVAVPGFIGDGSRSEYDFSEAKRNPYSST